MPELSNGFKSKLSYVRFNILVLSVGNLGIGLGIVSSNVEDEGTVIFTRRNQFFRFVYNNEKNTQLNV